MAAITSSVSRGGRVEVLVQQAFGFFPRDACLGMGFRPGGALGHNSEYFGVSGCVGRLFEPGGYGATNRCVVTLGQGNSFGQRHDNQSSRQVGGGTLERNGSVDEGLRRLEVIGVWACQTGIAKVS